MAAVVIYLRVLFSVGRRWRGRPQIEAPCSPVSCATMLAKKMGLSEMQAIMAAGFAGGIGLSGGACGALGAAIWIIIGMNTSKEESRIKAGLPGVAMFGVRCYDQ